MRAKVRTAETKLSPERTLDKLRRIQHQQIILNKIQPITGLTTIAQERNAIVATLDVKNSTLDPLRVLTPTARLFSPTLNDVFCRLL
jgi:hypothetical protein